MRKGVECQKTAFACCGKGEPCASWTPEVWVAATCHAARAVAHDADTLLIWARAIVIGVGSGVAGERRQGVGASDGIWRHENEVRESALWRPPARASAPGTPDTPGASPPPPPPCTDLGNPQSPPTTGPRLGGGGVLPAAPLPLPLPPEGLSPCASIAHWGWEASPHVQEGTGLFRSK